MLASSFSSSTSSTAAGTSASARRVRSRPRPPPEPAPLHDKHVSADADSASDVEADSPHSAPHMSISLFLDGGSSVSLSASASRSLSSAPRSPPPVVHSSSSQRLFSSSPISSSSVAASHCSPEPNELYFQSGDVIFVVPPSPAADYAAITSSPSAQSAHLSPSSTVLYPNSYLVHVYILPSLSCISTLRGHDSCVEQVYRDEWCDASDQVITQTALGSVYVWSLSTGELLQRMEARTEWLSAFLMTRRLFPLPAITQVSALVLDDSQMPVSAPSSIDDEDDAMLSGTSATVCVYENQRFWPLLGWSSKLLPTDRPPFSNAKGTREVSKKQFKLLPRWRWTSGWEVVRDDTTDVDGWSYAIDFTSRKSEYRGFHRKAFIHSVRRRRWIRHRQTMHEPTAQALASATLDDYIEHKQSTPLLLPPADSPHLAATRSLSHSPPKLVTQLSDKPPRSTPLLSPTPIKTRSRKAKTVRSNDLHHLATDEPRVLTRPTSRSSASDQEPPSVSLSATHSPSPHSAHVHPLSSSSNAVAASSSHSTSTSPSLPSPKARRRLTSATSRDNSTRIGSSSSPPASPSTLNSVLSRVQPSEELKQTIKRMLLSHNRPAAATTVPGKAATPAHSASSGSTAVVSFTNAASSTRLKAPRSSRKAVRAADNDTSVDEQKERHSSSSQQPPATASAAAAVPGTHSKVMESKEADVGSLNTQQPLRVKEFQPSRKKAQLEADGTAAVQQKESTKRKKPISYNTLPSPPRSGSSHSLTLPFGSSSSSLPPSPPLSPASATPQQPPKAIRVEVWENQRAYPVLGWSSRLLPTDPYPPFSDSAGHLMTFEMCELLLALDMDWRNEWTVKRSADTDADGWQYAVDWSWEWSSKQRVLTTVRRRCWVREKAVRTVGANVEGSQVDRVRRRKQLTTTLPATLNSEGKRRNSGAGNNRVSHSRSQSLYVPGALPQSSSLQSLSSFTSSSHSPVQSFSQSASSQARHASLSDTTELEHVTPPAYYDPSAGEPEEL